MATTAKIKKLIENGQLILPATIIEAIKLGATTDGIGNGGTTLSDILIGLSGAIADAASAASDASNSAAIKKLTAEEINALASDDKTNIKEAWKVGNGETTEDNLIKVYKDSSLIHVYLGTSDDVLKDSTSWTSQAESITAGTASIGSNESMNFVHQLADGTYKLTKVSMSAFAVDIIAGDGLTGSDGSAISVKIDDASESYLSVTSGGIKITGIDALSGLVKTNTDNITSVSGAVDTLSGLVKTNADNVLSVSGAVDTLSGLVDTNKTNIESLSGTVDDLSGVIDEISGKISKMATSDTITNLQTLVNGAEISGKINDNATNISTLSGLVDTNKTNIESLSGDLDTLSGTVDALNTLVGTESVSTQIETKINELSGKVLFAEDIASLNGTYDDTLFD